MGNEVKPTIRADHIGSLERPAELLAEVHRIYEAGHTAMLAEERGKDLTRLHELVSDGEFRRLMYFNSFFDAVDGVEPSKNKLQFRGDDGSVVEHEGAVAITGRVHKIESPAAREAAFTK